MVNIELKFYCVEDCGIIIPGNPCYSPKLRFLLFYTSFISFIVDSLPQIWALGSPFSFTLQDYVSYECLDAQKKMFGYLGFITGVVGSIYFFYIYGQIQRLKRIFYAD